MCIANVSNMSKWQRYFFCFQDSGRVWRAYQDMWRATECTKCINLCQMCGERGFVFSKFFKHVWRANQDMRRATARTRANNGTSAGLLRP